MYRWPPRGGRRAVSTEPSSGKQTDYPETEAGRAEYIGGKFCPATLFISARRISSWAVTSGSTTVPPPRPGGRERSETPESSCGRGSPDPTMRSPPPSGGSRSLGSLWALWGVSPSPHSVTIPCSSRGCRLWAFCLPSSGTASERRMSSALVTPRRPSARSP